MGQWQHTGLVSGLAASIIFIAGWLLQNHTWPLASCLS